MVRDNVLWEAMEADNMAHPELAVSWEEGRSVQGMKSAIFVRWSTAIRTVMDPLDLSSSITKSKLMTVLGLGGVLRGCRNPVGLLYSTLEQATKLQEAT